MFWNSNSKIYHVGWDHMMRPLKWIEFDVDFFYLFGGVCFSTFFGILGGWYCCIHPLRMDADWYITLGVTHPRQKWSVHRIIGVCWRGHACHYHCILGMLRSIEGITMHAGFGKYLLIPLTFLFQIRKTHEQPFITLFVRLFSSSASCWLCWWLRLRPAFMLTSIKTIYSR